MKYQKYQRNHVILPGREEALESFLKQDYKGMQHKLKNAASSNSEDALTWSCFDILANYPSLDKVAALDEIFEDSFQGNSPISFRDRGIDNKDIDIHVGKSYTGNSTKESTEVDASIEAPGILVFIEAKLYSSVSPASPPEKPHDQIARKLRVGLDSLIDNKQEFFFVFLDIAPAEVMFQRKRKTTVIETPGGGYKDKWRSAWLFKYYKQGRNNSLRPLAEALDGINAPSVETVAKNMGWLTWADLFKCTMRAALTNRE
tara:strand:+ start:129 stop:905 length:777 start_codon:yes stop_codon:yes gene_type:complete